MSEVTENLYKIHRRELTRHSALTVSLSKVVNYTFSTLFFGSILFVISPLPFSLLIFIGCTFFVLAQIWSYQERLKGISERST